MAPGCKYAHLWRNQTGLEVFNPRYFGYDIDYVPVERRLA